MLLKTPPVWALSERDATPESVYAGRRRVIRALFAAGALAATARVRPALGAQSPAPSISPGQAADLYPATRIPDYTLDRDLTDEATAARFNIFDEFSVDHARVHELARGWTTEPWTVHVGGRVEEALTLDVEALIRRIGLEERLYRHRCVETWAMAVPWTGFPLRRLVEICRPRDSARFVRFISVADASLPGWYGSRRVFPYYEALTMAEATNELAFVATGIYGHALPPQHGAPLRLVLPWKYGFKSIKSIVGIQFTPERPGTFWNDLSPENYDWHSNVLPAAFRGSWSQETETMLGTGEVRQTRPYNGYAEQVAHLYE